MKKTIGITIVILLLSSVGIVQAQSRRGNNPALDSLKNEKNPDQLQRKLLQLGQGKEEDLNLLLRYYGGIPDNVKADSILAVLLKKYPNGSQALIQFQNTLYGLREGKTQEEYYEANKDRFPTANMDYVYYSIANAYAGEGDVVKMKVYGGMVKDPNFRSATVRLNGRALMTKDVAAAEVYIRPEIEALLAKGIPADPVENDNQARGLNESRASYLEFMELYSSILIQNGKYTEALKYADEAFINAKSKNEQLKANYAFLLSKNGKHQEALPMLVEIVGSGKGNLTLKSALKESYVQLHPEKDATAFILQIEQGMKSRIETEVAKMLISEPAPNFMVKDIDGKEVSLKDFAGKTIVLDFWATWCGPCKKSFPAMQMAVDRYANDKSVAFLFIHTWENVADPLKDAKAYLSTNNFNMDLYMDVKDPQTKSNPAVTAFGVKGIPAKFVIDGNGITRFKLMGFSGGDDAAVAELSAMIDIAKRKS